MNKKFHQIKLGLKLNYGRFLFFLLMVDIYCMNWIYAAKGPKYNLKDFAFKKSTNYSSGGGWGIWIMLLILLGIPALFALGVYVHKYFSHKTKTKKISKVSSQNLQERFDQLELNETQKKALKTLAKTGGVSPTSILRDNENFEHAVDQITEHPDKLYLHDLIPDLREILGFSFVNRRTKFIKTQQIQAGQKLRATIPHPIKDLSFVTFVINCAEDSYWIKPPNIRGKPANISKIKFLEFRVFRQGDSEYRFRSYIQEQINKPMSAVIMQHSHQIETLKKREQVRYSIQLELDVSFITKTTSGGIHVSNHQNQSHKSSIRDMSTGGIKLYSNLLPPDISIGDLISFRLDEAHINKDIQAKIVKLNQKQKEKKSEIHVQFMNLTELNRLFVQRFIENKKAKEI